MNRTPIFIERKPECPYEHPFGYVYLITNKINGHRYVGKHVYDKPYVDASYWASGGEHLQNALKKSKNGKDGFTYEVLEWVDGSIGERAELGILLANREIYYIDILGTFISQGDYNETPGGDSWMSGELNPMYNNHRFAGKHHPMYGKRGKDNPLYGRHHTEESKAKMRSPRPGIAGENNPMYGVRLVGNKNPFYGRHHTEESKAKMSSAHTGKPGLSGKDNPMYGRHHTEESRRKMSESRSGSKNHNYGKPMPDEVKRKQRESHLGKKSSEETKKLLKDMWAKAVSQYDLNGNLIQEFNYGALSIGRNLKLSGKAIWNACCDESLNPVEGYIWKFRD